MEKMELKILYRSFVYLVQESKNYNFYARKIPVAQRKSSCRTDGANLPLEKFSFRWFNIKGFYTSFRISIMLFSTVLIETDPIFLSKKQNRSSFAMQNYQNFWKIFHLAWSVFSLKYIKNQIFSVTHSMVEITMLKIHSLLLVVKVWFVNANVLIAESNQPSLLRKDCPNTVKHQRFFQNSHAERIRVWPDESFNLRHYPPSQIIRAHLIQIFSSTNLL